MRILPHHQDTGGFFAAVFTKTKPIPPSARFISKLGRSENREGEEKVQEGSDVKEENEDAGYERPEGEFESTDMDAAILEELTYGVCIYDIVRFT